MLKKILKYIYLIITAIIAWIKDLFKKSENENNINNKEIKNIEKKISFKGDISTIPTTIGSKSTYNVNDIKNLEKEINHLLKNIDSIEYKELAEKIKELDKKINTITKEENKTKTEDKKEQIIQEQKLELLKEQKEKVKALENIYLPKKEEKEKHKKKKGKEKVEHNINIIEIDNKKKEYRNYIITSNKLIKEASKLTKEVDYELTLNKDNLDNLKYKVESLKEKISTIKKQYSEFRNSDYYYILEQEFELNELDEYKLLKDSKNIDLYIHKCDSLLQMIEYKKYFVKNDNKKEQPKLFKPKKPVLEEQPKVEVPKLALEIEEANNLVKKEILNEKKELKKINDKIDLLPIHERKRKRLNFFDTMLTSSFNIGVSLLPLRIFRNRTLGFLTTGFILNNRIRTMRRILNRNLECEYVEFNRRIKNQIDIINGYSTICNDSLYQISSLKDEFTRIYGLNLEDPEIKKTFTKLITLEEQILEQKYSIENTKVRLNNKIKIKKKIYKK